MSEYSAIIPRDAEFEKHKFEDNLVLMGLRPDKTTEVAEEYADIVELNAYKSFITTVILEEMLRHNGIGVGNGFDKIEEPFITDLVNKCMEGLEDIKDAWMLSQFAAMLVIYVPSDIRQRLYNEEFDKPNHGRLMLVLKSTTDIMSSIGLTDMLVDRANMRCEIESRRATKKKFRKKKRK